MNRLFKLQCLLIDEIDSKDDKDRDQPLYWEKIHMASCGRLGYILAEKRGYDTDLASCASAIHDFGRIQTGKQKGHAEAGYEPVKVFLKNSGLFTDEEVEMIAVAVKNHSSKSEVGGWLEEIVKDADVLDYSMYGNRMPRQEQQERLERLRKQNEY